MHYDEAFLEFLALIISGDFIDENTINGSVEIYRGLAEEEGENVKALIATIKTLPFEADEEEQTYTVTLLKDRIETDVPATNEAMKQAKRTLKGYIEGMFCVFMENKNLNDYEV